MPTIQDPFTDAGQARSHGERSDGWTDAEREMLLRGIAQNMTFAQIAKQISEELNDRTPKAVQDQWDRMRAAWRRQ